MPQYRRFRQPGGCYFFTVNLQDRRRRLLTDHIEQLRQAFRVVRAKRPFVVEAIVVLPDHLHAIWTLPSADDDFSTRWRQIKEQFTRSFHVPDGRSASRIKRGERGVWQRRFYEHVIRDENDFSTHIDYIHYNPVKHGHCVRPIDWPYSSLRAFVRRGVLPVHWGAAGIETVLELD